MKMNNTRRDFIKNTTLLTAGFALIPGLACRTSGGAAIAVKPTLYPTADGFVQEPLGYAYNALEPYIDAKTMEIHYTKHHTGYIKKLNSVVFAHEEMMGKSLEELLQGVSKLPTDIKNTVRNNGGGHWNHTFFWKIMTPQKNTEPNAALLADINKQWGGLDNFKQAFEEAGKNRFGSGWVWLIRTRKGLKITSTPNQDNPLMDVVEEQGKPILALDVWEHAYYLKYQNERGKYLKSFWNVVNWEKVAELYSA